MDALFSASCITKLSLNILFLFTLFYFWLRQTRCKQMLPSRKLLNWCKRSERSVNQSKYKKHIKKIMQLDITVQVHS